MTNEQKMRLEVAALIQAVQTICSQQTSISSLEMDHLRESISKEFQVVLSSAEIAEADVVAVFRNITSGARIADFERKLLASFVLDGHSFSRKEHRQYLHRILTALHGQPPAESL